MPYTSQGLMVNVVFMPWTPLDVCQFVGQWWFFVSPRKRSDTSYIKFKHMRCTLKNHFFDTPYKSSKRLTTSIQYPTSIDFRQFLGIPLLTGVILITNPKSCTKKWEIPSNLPYISGWWFQPI